MRGRDRKEGKVTGDRKDGNARLDVQAGLERVLRAAAPRPAGPSPSTAEPWRLIAMQRRKQQEMAQPHIFLHIAHPK